MVKFYRKSRCKNNSNNSSLKVNIKDNKKFLNVTIQNQTCVVNNCIILILMVVLNVFTSIFQVFHLGLNAIAFIIALLYLYQVLKTVEEESLVIIKNLGIQLTTKYIVGFKSEFIPQHKVQKIFINEVIYRHKVIFLLSLLTKETDDKEDIIPLFFDTKPRLPSLEMIYRRIIDLQSN